MLGMAGEDYTQECNWVRQGVLLKTQAFEDPGEMRFQQRVRAHAQHRHSTTPLPYHPRVLPSGHANPLADPSPLPPPAPQT